MVYMIITLLSLPTGNQSWWRRVARVEERNERDSFSFEFKNREGSTASCLSWTREASYRSNKEVMKDIQMFRNQLTDVWVWKGGQSSSGRASISSNHCS